MDKTSSFPDQERDRSCIEHFSSPARRSSAQSSRRCRAQGAPQTVSVERVDVQKLSAGYRSSKIVGSPVVNDANEKIGEIDDLLVEPSDKVLFAVLSVGGFLGMGEYLVVVPFNSLTITGNRVILLGSSKDALKALPAFAYATK